MNRQPLIIIGDSSFAQIAFEYFTADSDFEVVAFAVEAAFRNRTELFGLPVVDFEEIEVRFAPSQHAFFAAAVYTQLNRLRTRLYVAAKTKGYRPASFISRHAFVWRNVALGEHCFIFENNVVQPFVEIGNNVVLWSGNHIGHHTTIHDNAFVASHAVISGHCDIGMNTFIGVNATISNNVRIGADCVIGASAFVARNLEDDRVVKGVPGEGTGSARRLNRIGPQP